VGKSASTGAVRPVRPPGWWRVTTDAGAGAAPASDVDDETDSTREYDKMLESVDVAIEEARRKVESGRVRDAENERVRIKWIRAL